MQELGCTVTGIDYSEAMIDNAKKVMGKLGREGIVFRQMDAQKLDFEAESFDFIFSRNVTWTLPDPEQAYREMYRVLAPGGCILNFDANYGQAFKKQDLEGITEKQAVSDTSAYENPARSLAMLKERNQIAAELGICDEKASVLGRSGTGFSWNEKNNGGSGSRNTFFWWEAGIRSGKGLV